MTAIAVVIPCFKVEQHVLDVIARIGPEVGHIVVVDDACPNGSGRLVEEKCSDPRVRVVFHDRNKGVGGAVMTGYQTAIEAGAEVMVKIDGDGQMDPRLIPRFVAPILSGEADYTKGNRFYAVANVRQMPWPRLLGNAVLSFLTKLSSGYWSIFDPTNGYTAIHATALRALEFETISQRYYFESDMLANLGGVRAVVADVPMAAVYGRERSNLKIRKVLFEFLYKTLRTTLRRIVYHHFLRDFSVASIHLVAGLLLTLFGVVFGGFEWIKSVQSGVPATIGTVMVAALPIILGFELLLSFLSYDIANEPRHPLQRWHRLVESGSAEADPGKPKEPV